MKGNFIPVVTGTFVVENAENREIQTNCYFCHILKIETKLATCLQIACNNSTILFVNLIKKKLCYIVMIWLFE